MTSNRFTEDQWEQLSADHEAEWANVRAIASKQISALADAENPSSTEVEAWARVLAMAIEGERQASLIDYLSLIVALDRLAEAGFSCVGFNDPLLPD